MTLYNQILNLPLFQGLSRDDLSNIVAHTKFDFTKVPARSVIVKEGDPCNRLKFLLAGKATLHSHADDNSYRIEEDLPAPQMIEIERMFGLTQYYSRTVTALEDCSLLTLTKEAVMKLLDEHFIFRINLLNRLATNVQKAKEQPWRQLPTTLISRMLRFFADHCDYPAGHKLFYIKMQTLADHVRESRLNVSIQLNKWEDAGLVSLYRGRIDIPHLESLLQLKDNS